MERKKESELIKDARIWAHGSRGSVAFVIIIIITENKVVISNGKEKFSVQEAEERCSNGARIVESIGSVVDEQAAQSPFSAQWALAREVERLDAEGNLMKPLLGEVTAKMHVFRKFRDGDKPESVKREDGFGVEEFPVYRVAEADLFPVADDKPICLPWKEILGKGVGAGDQKKAFVLHPNEFQEGIEEAIPQRKKVCAQTRAAVILERNGELEAGPTFSELKRGVDIDDEYVPSETEGRAQKKRKTHS